MNLMTKPQSPAWAQRFFAVLCAALLVACSSAPKQTASKRASSTTTAALDAEIPDAVPRIEPVSQPNLRPYEVLGFRYTPIADNRGFWQEGAASWYGREFHGKRTANGEVYDMYEMTAAHPTLPLPSYARVTRRSTGKSVIVRINDRGPFHENRIIDLSYAAALKLDIIKSGTEVVIVEAISNDQIRDKSYLRPASRIVARTGIPRPTLARAAPAGAPAATPKFSDASSSPPVATRTAPPVTSNPPTIRRRITPPIAPAPVATTSQTTTDQTTTRVETRGVFLQFGAFSVVENATQFMRRLQQSLPQNEPQRRLQMRRSAQGLQRVLLGPYPTRAAAVQASQRIRQRTGVASVLMRQR